MYRERERERRERERQSAREQKLFYTKEHYYIIYPLAKGRSEETLAKIQGPDTSFCKGSAIDLKVDRKLVRKRSTLAPTRAYTHTHTQDDMTFSIQDYS